MSDFDTALNAWLERAQAICNAGTYAAQSKPVLTLQYGKRYVKVMRNDTGGRCVFCFIDLTTGDVLKAASIHTPAKGARGTIFEVGKEGVGEYGGLYKR
jgi:hypothetical protein